MGHQTNYAIRQDGDVALYYSNQGALTVPRDIFWGPDYAESFIRQNEKVGDDEWLDDVFAEGGVAFDADELTLVLFSGGRLQYPPLRDVLMDLFGGLWTRWDWTVEWAEWGIPDIARQVGVDPQSVTSGPLPSMIPDADRLGEDFWGHGGVRSLVSYVEGGEARDFVADYAAPDLMGMGDELVEAVGQLPTLEEARRRWEPPSYVDEESPSVATVISSCLLVDRDARRVEYSGYLRYGEMLFNEIRWADTGWSVTYRGDFLDGVRRHYAAMDRPLPEEFRRDESGADRSEDECLEMIADELFDGAPDPANCRERFGAAVAAMVRS